ncbi:MAG: sulfite dehydrogenase [Gemmatimonadaceae bacterium]|nr:sulfite dehydrogenase [Gemmatimonadaceae bacterium]
MARKLTRREMIAGTATALGAAAVANVEAQQSASPTAAAAPTVPADPTKLQGQPTSALGARSPFVKPMRGPRTGETTGSSYTPLQDLTGPITPADLHFERHHAGIPVIDPARHQLMIHGLVDRPVTLSLDDIKRFPQVTRTHFIECSGNGRNAFRHPKPDLTPQQVSGMLSTSEWTGVPLATLFREVGAKPEASWFLAEGGDACMMTRSVPMTKAWDDALIVWAQNGEPLRPSQGYPLRLLLPGWEGNINVKWLRRLELGTRPWRTRWETSKYTDPVPGNKAREFTFENDVKSIITMPSFPGKLTARGWHSVQGLAWSGRGRVTRVEVSANGGRSWEDAELMGPALPKAAVRFQYMLDWQGRETVLMSRATDEAGYTQPTRTVLLEARGLGTDYHFNQIVGWKVATDGAVTFHGES